MSHLSPLPSPLFSMSSEIATLFNESPNSASVKTYVEAVAKRAGSETVPDPEVKAYTDAVYFNYYTLGLSLLFVPPQGSKVDASTSDYDTLTLDGVDIFNVLKDAAPTKGKVYSSFPLPLEITPANDSESKLSITADSTGQDLVKVLGEPSRKGGGPGPSSGSISIWCEWGKLGIMVEFGGKDARGPQAWEKGKDAKWKVISLFAPKE